MWEEMGIAGIPEKLIRLAEMCLKSSNCRMRINGKLSDSFEVCTGLRQGDGLSPMLFNIVLERGIWSVTEMTASIVG